MVQQLKVQLHGADIHIPSLLLATLITYLVGWLYWSVVSVEAGHNVKTRVTRSMTKEKTKRHPKICYLYAVGVVFGMALSTAFIYEKAKTMAGPECLNFLSRIPNFPPLAVFAGVTFLCKFTAIVSLNMVIWEDKSLKYWVIITCSTALQMYGALTGYHSGKLLF